VPTVIEDLTRTYLGAVDRALPGFVSGLHIVGSAALGAWQPGVSDLDLLILTSRPPAESDLAELAKVHAAMPAAPHIDGVYLDPATLAERPADRRVVPFVVNGEFHTDRPCGELTPVLWLTLQRYGIAVRGTKPEVPVDPAALRRYNLDNLREYWQPTAAQVGPYVADLPDDAPVEAFAVEWMVLGPARLHYTLTHADVISKAAAGAYLAELFPQWGELARRAVRWRAERSETFTVADLKAAAESVNAVAEDAWRP
jgi:nucleotidyltransferase-like protein